MRGNYSHNNFIANASAKLDIGIDTSRCVHLVFSGTARDLAVSQRGNAQTWRNTLHTAVQVIPFENGVIEDLIRGLRRKTHVRYADV